MTPIVTIATTRTAISSRITMTMAAVAPGPSPGAGDGGDVPAIAWDNE